MKVFYIPSWQPTSANPITGMFISEHINLMAKMFEQDVFAVSLWGANNDLLLLKADFPWKLLQKIFASQSLSHYSNKPFNNLTEYFTPAFTWSRRLFDGNIKGIVAANEKNLIQFMKSYSKPDIIHAYVAHPGGYAAMELSKKYGIPFVITEEMSPFPLPSYGMVGNLSKWIERPYQSAWANIAVSESLKRKMEEEAIPRLRHVPNFVSGDFFAPRKSKRSVVKNLLFVGRLEHQKGVDILLKSFCQLVKGNYPNLRLHIGGDGSLAKDLKEHAESIGLSPSIDWHGMLLPEQVRKLIDDCDIFVLPSRHETFGIVVAEAMAMGKPVVATRCGGPEELVGSHSGLIVAPENVEQLSVALEKMIDNYSSYDPKTIRASCLSRFSEETVCHALMNLYKEIISMPKPL